MQQCTTYNKACINILVWWSNFLHFSEAIWTVNFLVSISSIISGLVTFFGLILETWEIPMLVTSCMEFKSQCTHQQFKHTACMYMQCKTLCGVNFMGRIRIATIVNLVLTIHYYQWLYIMMDYAGVSLVLHTTTTLYNHMRVWFSVSGACIQYTPIYSSVVLVNSLCF